MPGTRLVKTDQNKNVIFNIHASVLALRGSDIVPQPISSRDGSLLLLWNGEVFDSLDADFDLTQHDGAQLLRAMEERVAERCSTRARPTAIKEAFSHVLSSIDGPYAAVLIDVSMQRAAVHKDALKLTDLKCYAPARCVAASSHSAETRSAGAPCWWLSIKAA